MPIYEYRCRNEHRFEAFQPMADDPLEECEVCGAPVERVLSAPAVHFKGSGFYTTDYARKGKKGGSSEGGGESSKSESSEKSSEKKSDSGSSSANGSGSESKTGSGSKD